jgi:hypothetical protein
MNHLFFLQSCIIMLENKNTFSGSVEEEMYYLLIGFKLRLYSDIFFCFTAAFSYTKPDYRSVYMTSPPLIRSSGVYCNPYTIGKSRFHSWPLFCCPIDESCPSESQNEDVCRSGGVAPGIPKLSIGWRLVCLMALPVGRLHSVE